MSLPEITHLQFLVLSGLRQGGQAGRALRTLLQRNGVRRSGPAFYQMMARLEDGGLVEGRYDHKVVDGQAIKERRYVITAAGEEAWEGTRDFYLGNLDAAAVERETERA